MCFGVSVIVYAPANVNTSGRAHRFYTIRAAVVVSSLLALVLTLSLCVNAIAEPAGRSNEPAQGTEQAQEPEQTQEPEQAQEPEQMPPSTYTMETVLAGVDELDGTNAEKEAAKTYLRRYFCMNGDGRFFVMNHINFWGDRFYETTAAKKQARSVIDAYGRAAAGQTKGYL